MSLALLAWGCDGGGGGAVGYAAFTDEDPSVRLSAIFRAGEAGDKQAVPLLIDRLSDSEADVRFYAILSLKKITGQTMGYRYFDNTQTREVAVRRWYEWLAAGRPATMPASEPSSMPGMAKDPS